MGASALMVGTHNKEPYMPTIYEPLGNHSVYNTLSAAVTLTKPDGATHLVLQPITQAVYYTMDGTTPTASNGAFYLAAADADVIPCGDSVPSVRVIEAAASAKVNYIWLLGKDS
jgi:hypothetical protein